MSMKKNQGQVQKTNKLHLKLKKSGKHIEIYSIGTPPEDNSFDDKSRAKLQPGGST